MPSMFVRFFVIVYNLFVFPVFFPLNIMIVWINMVIIFCVPITEALLSFTLAANRLFVMVGMSFCSKAIVYVTLLSVSWILGLLVGVHTFVVMEEPSYNLETFRYHANKYYSSEMKTYRLGLYCVFLGISILMYLVIVLKIVFERNKVCREDIKLFVQAVIPFLWLVLYAIVTQYELITMLDIGDFGDVLYTIIGRSMPAVHCTVYMIFNRTLRMEVLVMLRLRNRVKNAQTVPCMSLNRSLGSSRF
uniref:G_PROTEIN_RECEP_F1_2 domain-containing protein n=1 Tax=Steinernema glaseri TaxID=37863 RepID=A0A1I8AMA7_9BILA